MGVRPGGIGDVEHFVCFLSGRLTAMSLHGIAIHDLTVQMARIGTLPTFRFVIRLQRHSVL